MVNLGLMVKNTAAFIAQRYRHAVERYKKWATSNPLLVKIATALLLILPIIFYLREILFSGDQIIPGDYSYFLQQYEAIRKSILEFGQFPWWNPWIAGGVPLFGNIQTGVFSIEALFSLIFGTVLGFKLSHLAYFIIGFFGFRALFKRHFEAPALKAALLAYIWTFGSFLMIRITGHNTFMLIELVPWILLFFLSITKGKNWLKFALLVTALIYASPHYIALQLIVVLGLLVVLQGVQVLWAKKQLQITYTAKLSLFKNLAKAGALILALCSVRLYFAYSFIRDFPRPEGALIEATIGIPKALASLFLPVEFLSVSPDYAWGWGEALAYIGFATGIALLLIIIVIFRKKWRLKEVFTDRPAIFIALGIITFLLALGNFMPFAPYDIMREFPVYDGMRVAARWLAWTAIFVLIIIASYKAKPFAKTITVLLVISVVELIFSNSWRYSDYLALRAQQLRDPQAQFEQMSGWRTKPSLFGQDENLYEGTINNYGQIIASDPLVFTAGYVPTSLCGVNQGCPFVSGPGELVWWSPNKIIIKRTNSGPITLNMNVGKDWAINGNYVFENKKVVETTVPFTIDDPSENIIVEYSPKFRLPK